MSRRVPRVVRDEANAEVNRLPFPRLDGVAMQGPFLVYKATAARTFRNRGVRKGDAITVQMVPGGALYLMNADGLCFYTGAVVGKDFVVQS